MEQNDRGSIWTERETIALIQIWGEEDIQAEFETSRRNASIYAKIAAKLRESKYNRTWKQCRSKIKTLRTEYFQCKKENNKSGKGRKTFKYFDQMDRILGHRPASNPEKVIDTCEEEAKENKDGEEDGGSVNDLSEDEELTNSFEDEQEGTAKSDETAEETTASTSKKGTDKEDNTAGETSTDKETASISKKEPTSASKNKPKKRSSIARFESAMESSMELFLKFQKEIEEREMKRRKEENELMVKEKEREREHELKILQLLTGMPAATSQPAQQQNYQQIPCYQQSFQQNAYRPLMMQGSQQTKNQHEDYYQDYTDYSYNVGKTFNNL